MRQPVLVSLLAACVALALCLPRPALAWGLFSGPLMQAEPYGASCAAGAPACSDGWCGGTVSDDYGVAALGATCSATWARLEYLMWWTQGRELPPLVTTSPPLTPRIDAGVLPPDGNATVLFGDEEVGTRLRSGGRVSIGHWLDACQEHAVVARGWGLEQSTVDFQATSPGIPILARPFFNVIAGENASQIIAFPLQQAGSINIRSQQDLLGADVYLRKFVLGEDNWRMDIVGGYQFTRLDDSLVINEFTTDFRPDPDVTRLIRDAFDTKNQYHAGQIGFLTQVGNDCWTVETLAKVGLGNMRQTARIEGSTITAAAGGPPAFDPQGLLARTINNIGVYDQDQFCVAPEVDVRLSYHVSDRLSLSVGGSFIYWSNVALAGNQIDPVLNLTDPFVGPVRPQFNFVTSDFWAAGLTFGVDGRF